MIGIEFQVTVFPLTGPSYTRYRRVKWPAVPRDGEYVELVDGWPEMVVNVTWNHDGSATVLLAHITEHAEDNGKLLHLFDAGWVLTGDPL